MNNLLIVATAAFLLLLPQFNNADAAGPYDGEWSGTATSAGERCKQAVVKFTIEGQVVLARISHRIECIRAANQRKPLCHNHFSPNRGAPGCRQNVSRICLDLNLLKDARWWQRSTPVWSPRMPEHCCFARRTAP